MLHAGILTNICPCPKSPSFVGVHIPAPRNIYGFHERDKPIWGWVELPMNLPYLEESTSSYTSYFRYHPGARVLTRPTNKSTIIRFFATPGSVMEARQVMSPEFQKPWFTIPHDGSVYAIYIYIW